MILGLAPMDGFTDYAFRQITKEIFEQYGDKKKYQFMLRTEFMNANGYLINPVGVVKHLLSNKEQAPLIAQIFGNDKDFLVKCFEDIDKKYRFCDEGNLKFKIQNSKFGFSGLELNLGCPAKTVIQNGGGSAMLKDRKNVLDILKDIKKHTQLPLSIKTRTGITDDDKIQQKDFLIQASKYCSMITIHGRTVKQVYSGDADRKFIYEIKQAVGDSCKILGNGGITSYEDAINRMKGIYKEYSDFDFFESSAEIKKRGLVSDGTYLPYNPELNETAGRLRKNMTVAEKRIWNAYLKQLDINVLRQKVIDNYIVDFYIPSRKLVIEIDGSVHFNKEAKGYDEERTAVLGDYGLEVIRFTNDDVINKFEDVCDILNKRITPIFSNENHPQPLFSKEGGSQGGKTSLAKGGEPQSGGGFNNGGFLLDGVLIGQAAIGNPRIFTPHIPNTQELKETILRHLDLMVASELFFQQQAEKFTGTLIMPTQKELDEIISTLPQLSAKSSHLQSIVVAFRKHLFQYIKGITGSKEWKRTISTIKDYETLVEEIEKFFG